jgi:3-deoxy-D-manno-octulosonic-acid transferase
MDKIGYILFIRLYPVIAGILSPFNKKAALWLKGRKNILHKIETAIKQDASKKIWMHCASLGEFEQGRPLLEELKEAYPEYKSVLTFFFAKLFGYF